MAKEVTASTNSRIAPPVVGVAATPSSPTAARAANGNHVRTASSSAAQLQRVVTPSTSRVKDSCGISIRLRAERR